MSGSNPKSHLVAQSGIFTGLHSGMGFASKGMVAAFVIFGPLVWLMSFFVTSIGDYLRNVVPMGFWTANDEGRVAWQELNAAGGPGAAGGAGIIETVRAWDLPAALYGTIDNLGKTSWMGEIGWLSWPLSALATILLASWFITSSDSGTLVITTMLSMGDDNPPRVFRVV